MGTGGLVEWAAWFLKQATEQDPEITEWDDEATITRKLSRDAVRKLKQQ